MREDSKFRQNVSSLIYFNGLDLPGHLFVVVLVMESGNKVDILLFIIRIDILTYYNNLYYLSQSVDDQCTRCQHLYIAIL